MFASNNESEQCDTAAKSNRVIENKPLSGRL